MGLRSRKVRLDEIGGGWWREGRNCFVIALNLSVRGSSGMAHKIVGLQSTSECIFYTCAKAKIRYSV